MGPEFDPTPWNGVVIFLGVMFVAVISHVGGMWSERSVWHHWIREKDLDELREIVCSQSKNRAVEVEAPIRESEPVN